MPHLEETEKPRYPKDVNIGRIVIEEIPEEQEVKKRDTVTRDQVKQRREDKVTGYDVEEMHRSQVQEDVIKVGRKDVRDYKTQQIEYDSEGKRRTTYTERLTKDQKVTDKNITFLSNWANFFPSLNCFKSYFQRYFKCHDFHNPVSSILPFSLIDLKFFDDILSKSQ